MEAGAFSDFVGGIGNVLNDVIGGAREILVERERRKTKEVDRQTAAQVSTALGMFELSKFRIVSLSLLGLAVIWFVTRRKR